MNGCVDCTNAVTITCLVAEYDAGYAIYIECLSPRILEGFVV